MTIIIFIILFIILGLCAFMAGYLIGINEKIKWKQQNKACINGCNDGR